MAKQKKSQSRRVPRASDPRMYGDGRPSQAESSSQAAAQAPTSGGRQAGAGGANVSPAVRAAGATPRTSLGAGGSYARGGTSLTGDYTYVRQDLGRLGIVAASIIAVLVVLALILP